MANPERGGASGEQKPLTPMERIRQAREALAAKQEVEEKGKAAAEEERGKAAEFSKRLGEVLAEAGALETLTRFAERFPENPEAAFALIQLELIADLASMSAEEWQEKYGGKDTNRERTLERAQKMLKDESFINKIKKQLGEKGVDEFSKD